MIGLLGNRSRRAFVTVALAGVALLLAGCDNSATGSAVPASGAPAEIDLSMQAAGLRPPDSGPATAFSITLYEAVDANGDPDKQSSVLELSFANTAVETSVPEGDYDIDDSNPEGEWYLLSGVGQQLQYVVGGTTTQLAAVEGSITVKEETEITWADFPVTLNVEGEFQMEPFPGGGAVTTVTFSFDGAADEDTLP